MVPMLAAAPLALLPGISDLLSGPRKALFSALGADESGSGSSLLQALLGLDPSSGAGKYGGLAAEMIGDPLNGVALGGMLAGKGLSGMGKAAKAGQLEGELGTANSMVNAAREAEATVPFGNVGPGNLPLGSQAEILPESIIKNQLAKGAKTPPELEMFGASRKKATDFPEALGAGPEIALGPEANRLRTNAQNTVRRGGDTNGLIDSASVDDLLAKRLGANAETNAATRSNEWAALGQEPVTGWDAAGQGGSNLLLEQLLGSPRLQGMMPGMRNPSQMPGLAAGVLPGIEAELAGARQAMAPREMSDLMRALLMGGYAYGGSVGGSRALQA